MRVSVTKTKFVISVGLMLSSLGISCAQTVNKAVFPKSEKPRIMAVGDSITEGKFLKSGGYRGLLQKMLTGHGYSFAYVGKEDNGEAANSTGFSNGMSQSNHEGYGSFRSDEILNGGSEEGHTGLPISQTMANNRPDVVLLMVGTNDVIQSHQLDSILGRLDALIGQIFASHKSERVLLATITPMSDDRRNAVAATYNSGIPLIVAKYKALGDKITLVDMYHALDPSHDLSDGIHPNPIGFQKMANTWFTSLTNIPISNPY